MVSRLQIGKNKTVLFLSSLMILLVALAISQSGWTDGLDAVVLVALGAIVIGLMASRSLLPGIVAALFSAIIGVAWTFWSVSRLLPKEFEWHERWTTMVQHIESWYLLAQQGGVIYDNLMFILQMGVIVWILGYLTIWFLFRAGKIWSSVIPGGIVLLINLYYAPQDLTSWFIAYLLVGLLLIVRFNLYEYEHRWRVEHVHFRSDISFDFLRNGLIFSVVVITLAWFTPAVNETQANTVFDRFDRQWRHVQEEWNRLFAGLNYKTQTSNNPNTFAQSHALSGARNLTEQIVMYVDADRGRYWRAVVYDQYDGNGWFSSDEDEVRFDENRKDLSVPLYEARTPITQTYTVAQDGLYVLYAMANAIQIDRETVAKTAFISPEEANQTAERWAGRSQPWSHEVTYIESDARLDLGDHYTAISLMSTATKEELRQDQADYPAWITERYLDIPDSTTQRVRDLAVSLTERYDNTYDKAEAIERYLRSEITYNEGIAAPPDSRDKVDYIVFDLHEAYCDYYATSMIVMLRSIGIPARFAAGYSRGTAETLENEEIVYQVKNVDAHSWVEVYFPTYGWIEFEPTAAQPVIVRQTSAGDALATLPDQPFPNDDFNPYDDLEQADLMAPGTLGDLALNDTYHFSLPFFGAIETSKSLVNWGLAGLVIVGVGVFGWRRYSLRTDRYNDASGSISDVYSALLQVARWMGLGKRPTQTPHEHATVLTRNLPPVEREINLITDEYVRQTFSPKPFSKDYRNKVLDAWDDIRPELYRAIFERRLSKIRLPFKW